jgi:hypothetical protein
MELKQADPQVGDSVRTKDGRVGYVIWCDLELGGRVTYGVSFEHHPFEAKELEVLV